MPPMRNVYSLSCWAVLFWMLVAIPLRGGPESADVHYPSVPEVLIMSVSGNHYPGIARAFATVGFQVREVTADSYLQAPQVDPPLLIIPEEEERRLDLPTIRAILDDLENGMPLLVDGPAPLAGELGVKSGETVDEITRYRWDRYAEDPVRLPGPLVFSRFEANPSLQLLAVDPKHRAPLVVSGRRGRGRFIYSAIPLEPRAGMVFQYLPFLAQAAVDELHVAPSLAADNLCVYVDVGGEPRVDPATVVAQLKSWSVREVHLGAFYASEGFREFVPRFLAAAHRQGIAVYAWLEYPMVSTEFWNEHPQWRELTARGTPAIMDWRYHMALEDPACFQAVAELTRRLVGDYDWDGVDFAELYFEGESKLFERPQDFTPMHPTFRKMFRDRYGVDPLNLFDRDSPDEHPVLPPTGTTPMHLCETPGTDGVTYCKRTRQPQ
jgi:hypothetical protein